MDKVSFAKLCITLVICAVVGTLLYSCIVKGVPVATVPLVNNSEGVIVPQQNLTKMYDGELYSVHVCPVNDDNYIYGVFYTDIYHGGDLAISTKGQYLPANLSFQAIVKVYGLKDGLLAYAGDAGLWSSHKS